LFFNHVFYREHARALRGCAWTGHLLERFGIKKSFTIAAAAVAT
jgi:hypothetical protein